jgi:predicted nucleotidyltransferase component of viral defense system
MLSYDTLIEQAKLRSMPSTKMRGVLREYLQILILKELYRTDARKQLFFTGGTYLRLIHGLKRFSEDLDFNALKLSESKFESFIKKIIIELKRIGLKSEAQYTHWNNILVANLAFPEVERSYGIKSEHTRKGGIIIKVETNRPEWKIKTEMQVVSGFGETYPCICTDRGALFADKIDAFVKKKIGRHLYDIMFMISNKFSIDRKVLKKIGIKHNPLDVIVSRVKNFPKTELKKQAEILRPFLFDETEAELIINARDIVPKLITQYQKSL